MSPGCSSGTPGQKRRRPGILIGHQEAGMRGVWLVMVTFLAVVADAEAVCLPSARVPGDPAYAYAASFIDALVYGKEATKRSSEPVPGESLLASATRTLTDLELSAKDFEC